MPLVSRALSGLRKTQLTAKRGFQYKPRNQCPGISKSDHTRTACLQLYLKWSLGFDHELREESRGEAGNPPHYWWPPGRSFCYVCVCGVLSVETTAVNQNLSIHLNWSTPARWHPFPPGVLVLSHPHCGLYFWHIIQRGIAQLVRQRRTN